MEYHIVQQLILTIGSQKNYEIVCNVLCNYTCNLAQSLPLVFVCVAALHPSQSKK